jgi:hypothetical protein
MYRARHATSGLCSWIKYWNILEGNPLLYWPAKHTGREGLYILTMELDFLEEALFVGEVGGVEPGSANGKIESPRTSVLPLFTWRVPVH